MDTMQRSDPGVVVEPIHPGHRLSSWPVEFWRSAVGKKWVMAVTGIILMGFVFSHMVGNLKIYQGAEHLNHYSEFLRDMLVPIFPRTVFLWLIRVVLIAAFVLHIVAAAQLTRKNRRARAGGYQQSRDWQASGVASRSMRFTGVVILLYLIWHLADFTWGWVNPNFVRGDVYRNVQGSLSNVVPAIIYVVANLALGLHLYHGGWSMFSSLGLNNPRYNSWRRGFAIGFAAIVTVGNLTFPLTIVSGAVGDAECIEDGDRVVTCEPVFSLLISEAGLSVEGFDELTTDQRDRLREIYETGHDLNLEGAALVQFVVASFEQGAN